MKKVFSGSFEGISAKPITVEASFSSGLPSFSIVGLGSASIQESKERVKSALSSNGFTFPPKRVTINLSPSDLKKEGTHFDLCSALLISLQEEAVDFDEYYIFGELGLDGEVKETSSLFALILSLSQNSGIHKAIVPKSALNKLARIPNIAFYGVQNLQEAISLLKGEQSLDTQPPCEPLHPYISIGNEKYFFLQEYPLDFVEVKGQENAKRAALISAAGMHNFLLEGSPGCGKSMIIKRLRYILPPMHMSEILNSAKLDALEGNEPSFHPLRPFRHPHHSSTQASIFGGGSVSSKIGEIALADKGLLFFDELPHFSKNVLEALREPLEDREIMISRVNSKITYPTDIMFVAAMNPCPCGNLLHKEKTCRCTDLEIQRYKNRLSEPFLDRIDISVVMQPISVNDTPSTTSKEMHEKVLLSMQMQNKRGQTTPNGKLNDQEIATFCQLTDELSIILHKAAENFSLSLRAINKTLRVARTIADIENAENIEKTHLLEALSYRRR